MLNLWKAIKYCRIIQKDRGFIWPQSGVKTKWTPPHCAFDVWVFLRWTQVLLPLPLPHGFQVIRIEGRDPSSCWHLLHHRASPEAQKTDPPHHHLLWHLIHLHHYKCKQYPPNTRVWFIKYSKNWFSKTWGRRSLLVSSWISAELL